MKKTILFFIPVYLGFACFSFLDAASKRIKNDESLFLNLKEAGLGALDDAQGKKELLNLVKIEKQKIQRKMLRNIYQNAFEFYIKGNYDEAKILAEKILSIDSNFGDAAMLLDASSELRGKPRPFMSRKLLMADKFKTALALFKDGRIIEAYDKMGNVVKLSPNNIKAKYWLKRIKADLKDYYFLRGKKAYAKRDLQKALDDYYKALMIHRKDRTILFEITKTEEELRDSNATDRLKAALEYYAAGKLLSAYSGLKKVLEIKPSDSKAAKLLDEVKGEIERGYIAEGKKYYGRRKYNSAISAWNKAKPYSGRVVYITRLINRTKEQIKREKAAKKRRAEEAALRRKEAAERKKKEEEDRKNSFSKSKSGPIKNDLQKKRILEENRLTSQQHYLNGLKYFQNSNYEKARNEWNIAKQLDPENSDAKAGLKRIEQILSGGR